MLRDRVLRFMRRRSEIGGPPVANSDVRQITGYDRHRVRRLMGELHAEGLVAVSGGGRGARYVYVGANGSSQ